LVRDVYPNPLGKSQVQSVNQSLGIKLPEFGYNQDVEYKIIGIIIINNKFLSLFVPNFAQNLTSLTLTCTVG
jgi:hypothetical protein